MKLILDKIIESKILDNFVEYQSIFAEFQSQFLTDLHSRYNGVENGNIILYYARETHHDILRQKDYDLNFNISYEKFWENLSGIIPKQKSITKIAEEIEVPKETVRRKVLFLTRQRLLNKINKNIGWAPSEQYKKDYTVFINKEIEGISRLIAFVCKKSDIDISNTLVTKKIKEEFSFYWFHYLNTQLEYLKLCSKQLKDIDLVLILLQIISLVISKLRTKKISHEKLFKNSELVENFDVTSISSTSIAEITSIPRPTCVRKLKHLVKLKLIQQDKISKRYYLLPSSISKNLISKKINEKVIKIFSNFFLIVVKNLTFKLES